MFGFGKKNKAETSAQQQKPVETDFGMSACKTCGGHVGGCSLTDEQLLEQLGFEPDHPKRKAIIQDARNELA